MDRDTVLRVPTFHQPLMNAKLALISTDDPPGRLWQSFIHVYWRSFAVAGIFKIKYSLYPSTFVIPCSIFDIRFGFSHGAPGKVFKDECRF